MKLKEALKNQLSDKEFHLLVRAYDIVGDMAITIIPPELITREGIIGDTILKLHKNVKVVAKRNGNVGGEFRTIPLKIIAGENRKETVHKEHGVRFCLNPGKVYFSVRSSNERMRLAALVKPGEDVLVMFSGIGAFPLVIAKISAANTITGIEKNLLAHEYAIKSLACNRKLTNVSLLQGDVLDVMPQLGGRFDRVLMPLPETGEIFLNTALLALKKGGWLHFYDFQQEGRFDDSIEIVETACQKEKRVVLDSKTVVCGHCSPNKYRICVDAHIQ